MTSKTLPQSIQLCPDGPVVPPLGIGTWAWGDSLFWSYGKDYTEDQLQAAFHAAVDARVGFFDTAEIYGFGESERLLGRFLKQTNEPVAIATKYFPLPWRFSADAVYDALKASLERLQVSCVTLYQVHWPFDWLMGQEALMNALADEVMQGRILAVGVSNYSAEQMRQAHDLLAKRGVSLAVNQVKYSLLARQMETNGVVKAAQDLEITLLAHSPLEQGLLTGKYSLESDAKPSGARQWSPKFSRAGLQRLTPVLDCLKAIALKHDRTPAQVSLNWLMNQGRVIPIPGAKNADQARQNAGALGWTLDEEDIQTLRTITEPWTK